MNKATVPNVSSGIVGSYRGKVVLIVVTNVELQIILLQDILVQAVQEAAQDCRCMDGIRNDALSFVAQMAFVAEALRTAKISFS